MPRLLHVNRGPLLVLAAVLAVPARAAAQASPPLPPAPPVLVPYAQPLPKTLPWEEGQPIPPYYRLVTRPRRGAVIASAVVGPVSYLVSALAASDALDKGAAPALIPVVGPFIALGTYRDDGYLSFSGIRRALFVGSGIGQVTAVGLLALGLAWPQKVLVLDQARAPVAITPLVGPGGLGVGGTF